MRLAIQEFEKLKIVIKQLQQENKELSSNLDDYENVDEEIAGLEIAIKELRQENERLKRQIENILN